MHKPETFVFENLICKKKMVGREGIEPATLGLKARKFAYHQGKLKEVRDCELVICGTSNPPGEVSFPFIVSALCPQY